MVDRLQQTGALAMDSLHSLDDWGVHLKDDFAFFSGKRVELECTAICDTTITARTVSKAVPMAHFRCEFPTWVSSYMDIGRNFTVVNFESFQQDGSDALKSRQGELYPIFHPTMQHCVVAEAFAGLGGWSFGAQWCGVEPALLVELDPPTSDACAKSHRIPKHDIDSAMQLVSQLSLPDRFVLQASVNDIRTHVIASIMGVVMWLASPPCQPWSKAGWQRGIEADEGAAFIKFVYLTGLGKARCLNLENVPGLPDHRHFGLLKQALHEAGWSLEASHVDQVFPLLPVMRQRWLATCVRLDLIVQTESKIAVDAIVFPECVPFFGMENSLSKFGCLHKDIPKWILEACTPSDDALRAMSDPALLPKKHRIPNYMKMKDLDVLALRVISSRRPLPNVMANQGSQHLLPENLLVEKGLHAYVLNDGDHVRYVSPLEIGLAMGFPSTIHLPVDFALAWKIVGNSLSVPHATLQCIRSHFLLGHASVFNKCMKGPMAISDRILHTRTMMEDFQVMVDVDWMFLVPAPIPPTVPQTSSQVGDTLLEVSKPDVDPILAESDQVHVVHQHSDLKQFADVIPISDDEHQSKRVCISPTWQMKDEEPRLVVELLKSDFPNCSKHTIGAAKPDDGSLDFACLDPPQGKTRCELTMLVKALHSQGIWAACDLIPKGLSVLEILQCFLPHARQEHLDDIKVNGWVARTGSILVGISEANILVRPFGFLRMVQSPFLKQDLPVEVDVMWSFRDLVAFVAAEAALLASQISLYAEFHRVDLDEFVLAYSIGSFHALLKPVVTDSTHALTKELKFKSETPIEVPFQKPQCDDNATPAHGKSVRFSTRHPKFGTVRSVSVADCLSIEEMIDVLLPGFPFEKKPQLITDGCVVDSLAPVSLLGKDKLELYFPGDKPWPCVEVLKTKAFAPIFSSKPLTIVRSVKGPFDYRAKSIKMPEDATVLQLVASFLELHCSNLTMIVLQGGRSVDVRIPIASIPDDMPLEIRVCGLPGGAKNNSDALSKKLADMLCRRGVPDDAKTARAALLTSKISHAELASILSQDETQAWTALKKNPVLPKPLI